MTLVWQPGYTTTFADPDVQAYLTAVEAADGQPLEYEVAVAINSFVLGCKLDGLWNAIKASCILAGARTLSGALVPLVGTAPTNYNFVAGDYNRETGLVGNGSTKYLDSNKNNNSLNQNNNSLGVFVNTAESSVAAYIGLGTGAITGSNHFGSDNNSSWIFFRSMSTAAQLPAGAASTGFIGMTRDSSSAFTYRRNGQSSIANNTSQTPATGNIYVFGRNVSNALNAPTDGRLQFYFIGESLDLAALDLRVTALIDDIGAAIP
jgi:hypothetical protein